MRSTGLRQSATDDVCTSDYANDPPCPRSVEVVRDRSCNQRGEDDDNGRPELTREHAPTCLVVRAHYAISNALSAPANISSHVPDPFPEETGKEDPIQLDRTTAPQDGLETTSGPTSSRCASDQRPHLKRHRRAAVRSRSVKRTTAQSVLSASAVRCAHLFTGEASYRGPPPAALALVSPLVRPCRSGK